MSHKGIRLLIQDVAQSLGDDIQFTYARTSDFSLLPDKRYPFISLDLLASVPEYTIEGTYNYQKRWLCNMAFYAIDKADSKQEEYQIIFDDMDVLIDQFINKLNFYVNGKSINSEDIILSSLNQQPFIKSTSDILTGFILTFQMQVTDKFNYCGLGC